MLVDRSPARRAILAGLAHNPIVALLGPRQCGKTTLARHIAKQHARAHYFDIEDPVDAARLAEPMLALEPLKGLVIIDEVQRKPEIFPALRVLADRRPLAARFLILGSASPAVVLQSSETLAGRIRFVELGGFTLPELAGTQRADPLRRLWVRGGFPRAFLAKSEAESARWREDFMRTFLERDLPQMGVRMPAGTVRRFWTMLAHQSGGIWNASALGSSLGEAHTTVRARLDALADALVVRVLQPWHANLAKRQIKSPKVYIRDSGILHSLLGIADFRGLESHPALGGSWEGFVIEQILAAASPTQAHYWRTQAGAELDLFIHAGARRIGVEAKYADAPTLTKSMHVARTDLALDQLLVVYPGSRRYQLERDVEVVPLDDACAMLAKR